MFRSIKWRLTSTFFAVTAVFLFLLGLYLMNSMEQYALETMQSKLVSYARLMSDDLTEAYAQKSQKSFFEDYAKMAGRDIDARVTLIDTGGRVLGDSLLDSDSMANHSDRPEVKKALKGEISNSVRYSTSLQKMMFYFASPVRSDNEVTGVVRVAIPWSEIETGQSRLRLIIGTSILAALILMVIVAASFTNELVVPLQEMTKVAGEMAEGKLETNIAVSSDDEIGSLGKGLNYMAQRLRDTISQITEERNKVEAILTSMTDGVIAVDRNENILLINPAVERMFNVSYRQSLGKSLIEVVRNYDLDRLLQTALASGESFTQEVQMFLPDPKTFRISTAPLTNQNGIVGVVAVMRDITALREVERMKTDFVANVSHELRTPLTSIKGFVETLLDGALDDSETARHFLEIINDETDRLNRLISDLLSLSRIEAKQLEINKSLIVPGKIIESTVSVLAPLARDKNLSLNIEYKTPLPEFEADEDMIGQLLINLIDNAIKYTPEGGRIDITAEELNGELKVAVRDTGIGIPRESIHRLFERFYRVDKARSREMGGTGLGLAIIKHILEVHDGRIELESVLGQGSTFTFFLPVKAGQAEET